MDAKVKRVDIEISSKSAGCEVPSADAASILWEKAASGEIEAFSELSNGFLDRVYRYIFYQVKDRQTAEELVTEIFLETFKRIPAYRKNTDYSIWQYQAAYDYMSEDPRFVSTLPFLEKQVVLFKFILGLSNHDVGLTTRTNESKIKMIQAQALSHLAGEARKGAPKPDKNLARILEECLTRISTGESIERCLFQYARQRAQLEPLLQVGLNIASVAKVSPGDDFRKTFQNNLTQRLRQITLRLAEIQQRNSQRRMKPESGPGGELKGIPSVTQYQVHSLPPKSAASELADKQLDEQLDAESGDPATGNNFLQKILQIFHGSKILAIAALFILLAVAAAAIFMTGAPGKISSLLASPAAGILNISSGSAEVQSAGGTAWQNATSGMKLKAGTDVKTDAASKADISFTDGSDVSLDASTNIEISQAKFKSGGPNTIILKQNGGSCTSEVVKLPTPDSQFEIQTPSAVVSVKGTHFTTTVDPQGNTLVNVVEGVVAVNAQGQEVSVNAGYQTTVENGKAPHAAVPIENTNASAPAKPAYTLKIKSSAGGTVSQPAQATDSYDSGTTVDLVATPGSGYAFTGWTGDITSIADPTSASTTITINGNYAVNANFARMYTLTIQTTGGSITQPGELTHDYPGGSVVKLSAQPDDGYQFVDWTGDIANLADPGSSDTTITVKGNATVTANFVRVYNLMVNNSVGGWVLKPEAGTHTYSSGTSVDIQAVPDNGYIFAGWNCNSNVLADPTAASTQVLMVKDVTLTPKFTKTQKLYSLTVNAGSGGRIEQPSGQSVYTSPDGTVVNLLAVPDSGYGFANWSGDTTNIANVYSSITTVTMKNDTALTANFVPSYTLTLSSGTGGTVTPPGGVTYNYNSGTVVKIDATPNQGYAFRGWAGDIQNLANPNSPDTFLTMMANTNITAVFTPVEYSLTVDVSGNGTVNGIQSGFYHFGDAVQLTAVPAPGWTFSGWGGDQSGNANPVSIIMNNDKKIIATFVQNN